MATVVAALIAACASVASALIAAKSMQRQRAFDSSIRQQERLSRSAEQVRVATLDALEITLMALEGQEVNGNVGEALAKVRDARDGYLLACAEAAVTRS